MLLTVACQARNDVAKTDVQAVPALAQTSAPLPPAASASSVSQPPVSAAPKRVNTVTVDARPYCSPDRETEVYSTWLSNTTMQNRVNVLQDVLEAHQSNHVGTLFRDDPKRAIVVMHRDFTQFEALQLQLAKRVAPLEVEVRTGCRERKEIDAAFEVLQARNWHPSANKTAAGWHLDPGFAGYRVYVDDAAPEVAEALRQRLGDLALVKLGKPSRLAQPTPTH